MLQRMCEDVEYIELLSLAANVGTGSKLVDQKHPAAVAAEERKWDLKELQGLEGEEASLMRLMLVAAYAMSNYSSTVGRTSKPFNPMLGETYELVDGSCMNNLQLPNSTVTSVSKFATILQSLPVTVSRQTIHFGLKLMLSRNSGGNRWRFILLESVMCESQ